MGGVMGEVISLNIFVPLLCPLLCQILGGTGDHTLFLLASGRT